MTKILLPLLSAVLLSSPLVAQQKGPITAQATRGKDLFVNSSKSLPCGTCHSMDGVGTAIGPDLSKLAAAVGPKGIVMTIHMTMTAYVQEYTTKAGSSFPGIEKSHDGDKIEVWDLGKTPPALRTLKPGDIASSKQNDKWKHPPASAGYTPQELADIVGFLKWAATGSQKEVSPSEIH